MDVASIIIVNLLACNLLELLKFTEFILIKRIGIVCKFDAPHYYCIIISVI